MAAQQSAAKLTDKELVRLMWGGDREAEAEFLRRWEKELHGRAFSILHNHPDADDCVQDTLIVVGTKIERFRDKEKFRGWIMTICWNMALEMLRRRKPLTALPLSEISDPVDTKGIQPPHMKLVREEEVAALRECLAHLSNEQQEAVILRYNIGYNYKKIAEFMHCPKSTVWHRIRCAHKTLCEEMERRGLSEEVASVGLPKTSEGRNVLNVRPGDQRSDP